MLDEKLGIMLKNKKMTARLGGTSIYGFFYSLVRRSRKETTHPWLKKSDKEEK
jgi:hypothetical protein